MSPEEKNKFLEVLKLEENSLVWNKLQEIIVIRRKALENSETNSENYDSPNWAYKQAHTNGCRQMLRWLETLLTL